ncbi:unnamed protein product [Moneuplotes crassus]|uniref:Uncharacterized protein n=2 Tax=Euplotes crassus TaxID=5936 RepID=A0AAD1U832_EUPCR|nr:unnamed protein product [Moneuplotes crassus]
MESLPKIGDKGLLKKWNLYEKSRKKRKITMRTPQLETNHEEDNLISKSAQETPNELNNTNHIPDINEAYKDDQEIQLSKVSRNLAMKSKERALKSKKSMSKGMVRNYRRYEEQKQLKIENIRLLKRLQNSNPTYNYNEYEMENKKKKRLLNRICNFPYQFDKSSHKRTQSKLNIRRKLSIQKMKKKTKKRYLSHTNSEFKPMHQSQEVASNIKMTMEEENKMREEQFDKPLDDVSPKKDENEGENLEGTNDPTNVSPSKRYHSKKSKDRKALLLRSMHKKRIFYREYLLTNVFNSEFDRVKKERVRLEKFIKISGKDCFLTVCTSPTKYFFMAICCKTKEHYLISVFKKKVKKLLQIYNKSLAKVVKILRIKDGHMFIKDLDYLLRDQLDVRGSLPDHFRLNKGYSKDSGRNSPRFPSNSGNNNYQGRIMSEETLSKNETVTVQDINKLPKL